MLVFLLGPERGCFCQNWRKCRLALAAGERGWGRKLEECRRGWGTGQKLTANCVDPITIAVTSSSEI